MDARGGTAVCVPCTRTGEMGFTGGARHAASHLRTLASLQTHIHSVVLFPLHTALHGATGMLLAHTCATFQGESLKRDVCRLRCVKCGYRGMGRSVGEGICVRGRSLDRHAGNIRTKRFTNECSTGKRHDSNKRRETRSRSISPKHTTQKQKNTQTRLQKKQNRFT